MTLLSAVAGADERSASTPVYVEVLDVGHDLDRECGHLGLDLVRAGTRGLDDHVGDIVDDVDVVARQADHRVGIEAAIEDVVVAGAGSADQQIVAGTADEFVVAGAAEDQVVADAAGDLVVGPCSPTMKLLASEADRLTPPASRLPADRHG